MPSLNSVVPPKADVTTGDPNTVVTPDPNPVVPGPTVNVTGTAPLTNSTSVDPTATTSPSTSTGSLLAGMTPAAIAAIFAGIGQTNSQNQTAQSYTTQSQADAAYLNPYGAYRDAAAQQLAALQKDPSSVSNTPGFNFALQQGLGAVSNRDNRSFGVGAGSTNPDLMNYAQGLASKTYNDPVSQLQAQAGGGISPQPAASILQTGMQGNIAATAAANAAKGATTGAAVTALTPAIGALTTMLTNSGMSAAAAAALAKQIMGSGGGGSNPSGGNVPAGTTDANGNISNGDGTFNTPSGTIVDANGAPIDPYGPGAGSTPTITDPSTGAPLDPLAPSDPNQFNWNPTSGSFG